MAASVGHSRQEEGELGLVFGSVVTEKLVATSAAPFTEVVVAPMCFCSKGIDVVHGDDFFAEGRAEALLQVDEHLRNKFRTHLVSLAARGMRRRPNSSSV